MTKEKKTDALLNAAQGFVPMLRERATEIEKNRSLPQDIADQFAAAGFYSLLVPESLGGYEIDPLTYPIENDPRLASQRKAGDIKEIAKNPDGSPRREYPYEPLPRSGLAHPYVQAILSP